MLACLEAAVVPVRTVTLPHVNTLSNLLPDSPVLFGWPAGGARWSVAVANADSAHLLESFLPRSFWGERSVGYWVWETEQLPSRFSHAQELFDEIWTPSAYSAAAIRRTVDRPVHVLPHTIDIDTIASARADRRCFGLPEGALLFGFAEHRAAARHQRGKHCVGFARWA